MRQGQARGKVLKVGKTRGQVLQLKQARGQVLQQRKESSQALQLGLVGGQALQLGQTRVKHCNKDRLEGQSPATRRSYGKKAKKTCLQITKLAKIMLAKMGLTKML